MLCFNFVVLIKQLLDQNPFNVRIVLKLSLLMLMEADCVTPDVQL